MNSPIQKGQEKAIRIRRTENGYLIYEDEGTGRCSRTFVARSQCSVANITHKLLGIDPHDVYEEPEC